MTCPHCAASISESDERCPYCDSYIDHGRYNRAVPPAQEQKLRNLVGEDKVNPFLMIIAFIPMIGIILGAVFMSNGYKKSGKAYLIAGIVGFAISFSCPFISMLGFAIASAFHA